MMIKDLITSFLHRRPSLRFIAISVLFFIAIIIVTSIAFSISNEISESDKSLLGKKDVDYHFVLVEQNLQDPFWNSIRQGAVKAAEALNVAVECLGPGTSNINDQQKFINTAIASKVDGIITYVPDEEIFKPIINMAIDSKIPVVTAVLDARFSKRNAHIGIDSYEIGEATGKAVIDAIGEKGNIALIVGGYDSYRIDEQQYQQIKGLNEYLKKYKSILVIREQYSNNGLVSAAQITRNILSTYNSIDAIVCTTPMEALGAAQVLIEQQRQDHVKIVAYEENTQLLKYINDGVIYGTVVSNPFQIGYKSVTALFEMKKYNRIISDTETNLEIVTKENVAEYVRKRNELEGTNIKLKY